MLRHIVAPRCLCLWARPPHSRAAALRRTRARPQTVHATPRAACGRHGLGGALAAARRAGRAPGGAPPRGDARGGRRRRRLLRQRIGRRDVPGARPRAAAARRAADSPAFGRSTLRLSPTVAADVAASRAQCSCTVTKVACRVCSRGGTGPGSRGGGRAGVGHAPPDEGCVLPLAAHVHRPGAPAWYPATWPCWLAAHCSVLR